MGGGLSSVLVAIEVYILSVHVSRVVNKSSQDTVLSFAKKVLFQDSVLKTPISLMNLKTAFKDTCKQQDDVIMRKLSVGKNSLFFPQREGRREGEEL